MSQDASNFQIDERIQAMLDVLEPGDLRYTTLKSTVDFQSAWLDLAEHLYEVDRTESYREWGYRSFAVYCTNELRLTRTVAGKLLEGYQWVENQAPEYLPGNRPEDDEENPLASFHRPVPDVDTISVLAKAQREVKEERLPEATYDELKTAALRGERSLAELRKDFREAVPEHLRPQPEPKPLHHLRRALTEVEKALTQISEDSDAGLLSEASALRDAIYAVLSAHDDEQ